MSKGKPHMAGSSQQQHFLPNQDLKGPNSYVNVNTHLRQIINYCKLTLYGNLRLVLKGG